MAPGSQAAEHPPSPSSQGAQYPPFAKLPRHRASSLRRDSEVPNILPRRALQEGTFIRSVKRKHLGVKRTRRKELRNHVRSLGTRLLNLVELGSGASKRDL
ncbi:hypothetical protein Droror1_Dr00024580, partial [Drosera rotundifolia]